MLGGLLKPNWQHKLPEKRLKAIESMPIEADANQAIFAEAARSDTALEVRLASICRLSSPEAVFELFELVTSKLADKASPTNYTSPSGCSQTEAAARKRFCDLIGPNTTLTTSDFEALLAAHPNCSAFVAEHCPVVELRHHLIEQLDQAKMAALIADVTYVESRQLIAERLTDVSALETARKNLKGKDKTSERIIRQKLDDMRSALKREQANSATAEGLCEQLEFIANHPEWRTEFKDRFLLYQQRWNDLDFAINDQIKTRFSNATERAKLKVDQQTRIERAASSQQELSLKLERYCASLTTLSLEALSAEKISINSILSDAIHSWLSDTKISSPTKEVSARFTMAQKALSSLSELVSVEHEDIEQFGRAISQVSWPSSYPSLRVLAQATADLQERKSQTAEQRKELKENLDKLHKRINRLIGTTNKGDIRRAKHELNATTKAASKVQGKERKILDERLEQAAETVGKMSDWQAFATEPKLIELCEQMEALTTSKTHPDKLSTQITNLQNQWKALGHCDVSDVHWPRFKTAADQAYQPCALFFEERKQTRAANLAKREPLLQRTQILLDSTDWDGEVDYKHVETELRSINEDWRKIKDVERRAGQKQWEKLGKIKDQIYAKLDVVYDANIELKKQLITQVSALAETNIGEGAVAKLQLFQNRWKQVGVTRRKQDQAAWREFKAASDKVYGQLQEARKAKRSEQDEELDTYRSVINAINTLSKSAEDLNSLDKGLSELQSDYVALAPFSKNIPEKLVEKIDADYKRALNGVSKASDRLTVDLQEKVQTAVKQKADLCSEIEALRMQAKTTERADQTNEISRLTEQFQSLVINDKALEQKFEQRLASSHITDRVAFTDVRRKLCIELEILLGVESPEADRGQRMQMQLDRMQNKGLGLTAKTTQDLQTQWWCLPGGEPAEQASLQKRFDDLIKRG